MHGRPRNPSKPEDAAALSAKVAELRVLQSQFLHNHLNKLYTKEALEVSAKLLEINPEAYTGWNYRKLAVEFNLSRTQSDPDSIKSIFDEELKVAESALRQNFKSYGAWHHRKWILSKGYSSADYELRLLDKFQKADPRNFHAWNYRRFIASLKNRPETEELDYSTNMIESNFSNYSAWHNRSVILSKLLEMGVEGFDSKEKVLTEEFDLVHNALFTSPDDQSGWFYHCWLLNQTIRPEAPFLVSSWPAHASDLSVSEDWCIENSALSPFNIFVSEEGIFPLVIYFDQAVKGVNSSTVKIESVFSSNTDLIWKPLTQNNSGTAQAWVTHLSFLDSKSYSAGTYPVKVSIGRSQGIVASSNAHFILPSEFTFTVCVRRPSPQQAISKGVEKISWKNENFRGCETSLVIPFSQHTIVEEAEAAPPAWSVMAIANEITQFRELLSLTDCKIGKLTLARLLMAHDLVMRHNMPSYKAVHNDEVMELFNDLVKSDPSHNQYYKDENSLVLMQKITSSGESLLKYCYQYKDSTSSNSCYSLCLKLNNLSLSRIGSTELLLWVQVLDLSQNELQTIEGLEAMQLLCCLNLSKNKICSFMALEPLKHLSLLKVLDISYNEIGAHSIDTARYLCTSPLSHTTGMGLDFNKVAINGGNVRDYWEALLILEGLNLTQLDVVGNAISNGIFESFLVKVLHTLKWLNGEEVL